MIHKWWQRHKQRQAEESYQRGYNWCAGQLLRCGNDEHVHYLEEVACGFDDHKTGFKTGMWAALDRWEKIKKHDN